MVYIGSTAAAKYHADLVKFVQGAMPLDGQRFAVASTPQPWLH
jgi:hypothetical protein